MNADKKYMYYDTASEEWTTTTLGELLRKNDTSLTICEVLPDGTAGEQMSYRELLRSLPRPSAVTPAQNDTLETIAKHLAAIRFGIAILITFVAFARNVSTPSTASNELTTFLSALFIGAIVYFILAIPTIRFGKKK